MFPLHFCWESRRRLLSSLLLVTSFAFLTACGELSASLLEEAGLVDTPVETPTQAVGPASDTAEEPTGPDVVEGEPNAPFQEEMLAYLSIEHGVALRHPASWVIQEEPFLALATSEALLISTAGQTSGALLSIVPAPPDIQLAEDLNEALSQFLDQQDAFQVVFPPQTLTWSGQEAVIARGVGVDEEGLEFVVLFGLVRNQGSTLFLSGVTPDHIRYEGALRDIMESIIVSQSGSGGAVPLPEEELIQLLLNSEAADGVSPAELPPSVPTTYRDGSGRFQLRLPAGWRVDDGDPNAILLSSQDKLIASNELDTGAVVWIFPQTIDVGALGVPADTAAVELLSEFVNNFGIYDTTPEPVLLPAGTTIAQLPAATAQYDAAFQSFPVLVDYYAVLDGDQVLFFVSLIASGSVSDEKPVTDQLIESVIFLSN
ncbi:MAG: hypothetical protein AAF633_02620 [Chloroflexota bacterium]